MNTVRNCSHMCACGAYSSYGYYLRAAFVSLRASDCAATIRGQRLFEGGVCSKKYSRHIETRDGTYERKSLVELL